MANSRHFGKRTSGVAGLAKEMRSYNCSGSFDRQRSPAVAPSVGQNVRQSFLGVWSPYSNGRSKFKTIGIEQGAFAQRATTSRSGRLFDSFVSPFRLRDGLPAGSVGTHFGKY